MEKILVELKNEKALKLLEDLEELQLINIFREGDAGTKNVLDKYYGIISKEHLQDFEEHITKMRDEWNNS